MSFGIGEAQVYLGGVDVQFECHLVSVKPRCTWVGLMISLGAFGIGEAHMNLGGVGNQCGCHLVSAKPRCTWAGLMISLSIIWYR